MVLFCHKGGGSLSWAHADESDMKRVNLQRGDIYRLRPGSVFYMQSNSNNDTENFRIYAIFATAENDIQSSVPSMEVYSRVTDLVRGFDRSVIQQAFQVSEEVIDELMSTNNPQQIVHATQRERSNFWELETGFLRGFLGGGMAFNKKKHAHKAYNIHDETPDFENSKGWSTTVSRKNTHLLKGTNIGFFMVNLTRGSMMGPHWNPLGSEIGIVLQGRGIVHVVCSSIGSSSSSANSSECRNMRLKVNEGDTFMVRRFHAMAQMSFMNGSFVFMGFSTSPRKNYPQFLAGKSSFLRVMDRQILAMSFNVSNNAVDQILQQQDESVILGCSSCAEEEETVMKEECRKRGREEQEHRRRHAGKEEERKGHEREEEERRRQEEEAERHEREREEEERGRHGKDHREEEESRRREEEEKSERHEKEKMKRDGEVTEGRGRHEEEERETKRREEERKRKREGEEARRRHEEQESQTMWKEVERHREREEEAQRKRHEEQERERHEEAERRRYEEEEEEAAQRRHEKRERQRGHEEERAGGGSKERGVYPEEEGEEGRRYYKIWKI